MNSELREEAIAKFFLRNGSLIHRIGRRAGKKAGRVDSHGYVQVHIFGKKQLAHRIVWLMCYGSLPPEQIDHRNGNRRDNRIENLRLASAFDNSQNIPVSKVNTSGFTGVSWNKRDRLFQARIQVNKKVRSLGFYMSAEEAHQAYVKAKKELHGFQPVQRGIAA